MLILWLNLLVVAVYADQWHLGPDGTRAFWIHRKSAGELAAGTTIHDVVDYCTVLSSHVFLPRTAEEHSFVVSLVNTSRDHGSFRNSCGNYMECGGIFLGMTDEQEEGVWRSLGTGEVVYNHSTGVTTAGFYTNWKSNEPGDSSFQDTSTAECAALNGLITLDESYDQSCSANPSIEYLICEREVCLRNSDHAGNETFSAPDGRSFAFEMEAVTVTCSASEVVSLDGVVQNSNTATVRCSSGQLESTPTCETVTTTTASTASSTTSTTTEQTANPTTTTNGSSTTTNGSSTTTNGSSMATGSSVITTTSALSTTSESARNHTGTGIRSTEQTAITFSLAFVCAAFVGAGVTAIVLILKKP